MPSKQETHASHMKIFYASIACLILSLLALGLALYLVKRYNNKRNRKLYDFTIANQANTTDDSFIGKSI